MSHNVSLKILLLHCINVSGLSYPNYGQYSYHQGAKLVCNSQNLLPINQIQDHNCVMEAGYSQVSISIKVKIWEKSHISEINTRILGLKSEI